MWTIVCLGSLQHLINPWSMLQKISGTNQQLFGGKGSISYLKLTCVVTVSLNLSHSRQNICQTPWAPLGFKFFHLMHA